MLDFLKNNFYLIFYGITSILSIIKLPKYYDSFLKFIPIIIGYTLITEFLGTLIYSVEEITLFAAPQKSHYNVIIYNIYDFIFFPYFYYVYWHSIGSPRVKMIIKIGGYLFVLSMLVNAALINPMENEMWYAYSVGTTILIICILAYLYALMSQAKKPPHSRNLLFWISIGLLLFHMVYLPITLLKNMGLEELNSEDFARLKTLQLYAITVMYSCFILGFILMERVQPKKI